MDRIVLEGARKYHFSNNPTYSSRSIPSVAQHWDEQSDVAPYPIIRPSCYYDSKRRYDGDEMRQIVDLSRSYMQGYRSNQGDFDLDEARLLARPNMSVSCCSTLAISIACLILTASSLCPGSSQVQISTPLRSCWRRMALNDTENFSTNTSVCVSSPYQMVNRHQLQKSVPATVLRRDWNSSTESSSKANA